MKLILLAVVLVAGVFAEPDSDPKAEAAPISEADSKAAAWYYTYGTWPVGYTGYYYYHPYAVGYLYGRKKRSADAEAEAAPISEADSKAAAWYYTYGTWPVGYTGYYYYHPYAVAYLYGRKKRSAEGEAEAAPISEADSKAAAWYYLYGSWPVGYTGYYYYHPYAVGYLYGRKKRSAEGEAEAAPISEADSKAAAWYYTYGTWPVGYTGYYYYHPYAVGYLYGRKKRSADAEPAAITKADSDALSWYYTYGSWPVGYTGYYYYHPYVLGSYYYGK